ncbi:hypothetical protein [Bradyrhizobium sp. LM2.3]
MTVEKRAAVTCAVVPFHVSRSIQIYDAVAAHNNISLLMGFDFQEYVSITQAAPTKGKTFPKLSARPIHN